MKQIKDMVLVFLGLAVGLFAGYLLFSEADHEGHNHSEAIEAKEEQHQEEVVKLTKEEMKELGIVTQKAESGLIEEYLTLTGEVIMNPLNIVHLRPRFEGIVREINVNIGDKVRKGETVAIIEGNESMVLFELKSSIDGVVTGIHMAVGELKGIDDHSVEVADLNSVWGKLTLYQKDLNKVSIGQSVVITEETSGKELSGKIDYISPIVDEATRTASARVTINNKSGFWKPGLFIQGDVAIGSNEANIKVAQTAVQTFEGNNVVFIKDDHGFEPRIVKLGKSNGRYVNVLSGLEEGDEYVSQGAFNIKADLQKESFGGGHSH